MDLSTGSQSVGGGNTTEGRDYRKGNWTIEETMVLMEAKKMDEERRMKRVERGKGGELRWKWVEDYCWGKGCFRSQNQCNDKWDNLTRDFKKVRDYEAGIRDDDSKLSYWRIEKNERKDKNLPSNMLPQIYEALVEVMEKKDQRLLVHVEDKSIGVLGQQLSLPHPPVTVVQSPTMHMPPPCPPAAQTPTDLPFAFPFCQEPLPTVGGSDCDDRSEEYSGSPAKRRRKRSGDEGTSGAASGARLEEVGCAISRSGRMIAEAIQTSEEREERRHREMMSLNERERRVEVNGEGINGLADAINNLANSILALAAHNNPPSSK